MRVDVELNGINQLFAQLRELDGHGEQAVSDTIAELALLTERTAVQGVRGGAATGRVYRRGSRTHQASAPGEYPASDTGRLMGSIMSDIQPMEARVGTNLEYGRFLEFGTSRMAPRPWLFRSFEAAKVGVERRLKAAFERRAGR